MYAFAGKLLCYTLLHSSDGTIRTKRDAAARRGGNDASGEQQGTNVDITWMSGVYAPTGTPRAIVARLNREIGRIMQTPETRALLSSMAAEGVPTMTPETFAAHQQRARDRFGAVVRDAGIRVN